ncbi:helix-turn-helix transcriptional regulator, partial [Cellulomonas biazotea]
FERARRRVEDAVRAAADEHADLAALGEIVAAHARTPAEVVSALRGALAVAAVDEPAAHRLLERALDVAERAGVRRPFVELEPVLHDLLVEHLRWGSAHEEVVAALVAGDAPRRGPRGAWGSLELTEREHQVLVRLRSTMTTTEIAAALFVSGNTVKTHQRSIYRKLGVAGRRDALRVAAERGLL